MNKLLIDIGNTRIKWRVADVTAAASDGTAKATPHWRSPEQFVLTSEADRVESALQTIAQWPIAVALVSNVSSSAVEAAVIGAVSGIWGGIAIERIEPLPFQSGVANRYREPARLGPDRWLALIAAHALFPDVPLLVCSFGTATTIDLLLPEKAGRASFIGGLILPGFDAMRSALSSTTERLPLASGQVVDFADGTDDAIASGVFAAQVGAVERAVRNARALSATGVGPPLRCVIGGGAAARVTPLLSGLDVAWTVSPDLVLQGLAVVAACTDVPRAAAA